MTTVDQPTTTDRHHHGVVAVVTNPERSRFFIQQKDEAYRPFPLGYSLFGGAIEPGEDPEQALTRELREELGTAADLLIAASPTCVLASKELATGVVVSLFEIIIEPPILESLAKVRVLEGLCGVVLDREQLASTPLVWGLHEAVTAYFERTAMPTRNGS